MTVSAPARLHMGFLDLHGGLGRNFGSLGLAIDGVKTRVTAMPAAHITVSGAQAAIADSARTERTVRLLLSHHDEKSGVEVIIDEAIPRHVGLGSGTQLALTLGAALASLFGWPVDARSFASIAGRGGRSGIGIGAFAQGGFLIDGGRGRRDEPPPIIARSEFPQTWRVLLIFDRCGGGIHGEQEIEAFQMLPEFPASTAAELCRLTLMQALPALHDHDIDRFGAAIGAIQKLVGDYFAPAQGGRYASPLVTEVLEWLEQQGILGVGQSSWGPTGFALIDSDARARGILRAALARWGSDSDLTFMVCAGQNQGADISAVAPDDRQRNVRQR